ncbi:hypothetical protein Tco_0873190, partial [Tanacetum coccineum]
MGHSGKHCACIHDYSNHWINPSKRNTTVNIQRVATDEWQNTFETRLKSSFGIFILFDILACSVSRSNSVREGISFSNVFGREKRLEARYHNIQESKDTVHKGDHVYQAPTNGKGITRFDSVDGDDRLDQPANI